jgi:hypothetical protein
MKSQIENVEDVQKSIFKKIEPFSPLDIDSKKYDMNCYDSDDDMPLMPPAYDSDDEPLMRYSTPKQEEDDDSDDEPLMPPNYDSDDEPLMRYSTPKQDEDDDSDDEPLMPPKQEEDDDDDKPLMPPPTAFAPVHLYTQINIRPTDDTDDINYQYLLIERRQERKRRWDMVKKSCSKKTTMSEKWRDMRAVINTPKRKDKQQRVKALMDKYGFKIKAYYNMNKNDLECGVARALWV